MNRFSHTNELASRTNLNDYELEDMIIFEDMYMHAYDHAHLVRTSVAEAEHTSVYINTKLLTSCRRVKCPLQSSVIKCDRRLVRTYEVYLGGSEARWDVIRPETLQCYYEQILEGLYLMLFYS